MLARLLSTRRAELLCVLHSRGAHCRTASLCPLSHACQSAPAYVSPVSQAQHRVRALAPLGKPSHQSILPRGSHTLKLGFSIPRPQGSETFHLAQPCKRYGIDTDDEADHAIHSVHFSESQQRCRQSFAVTRARSSRRHGRLDCCKEWSLLAQIAICRSLASRNAANLWLISSILSRSKSISTV